jgi:nucleoside-diphosphate-sugar epimerase
MVTGASGFVGTRLSGYLRDLGRDVVEVSRNPNSNSTSIAIDLVQERVPNSYLKSVDCIVHCVARAHIFREVSSDPLAQYRAVNVEPTLKLARAAAKEGVSRFIFLSSIGVNGNSTLSDLHPNSPVAFDEKQVPSPHDFYAISKWEAEQGLWQIQRETGIEVVIIRPPLVYGPDAKGNFASLLNWVGRGVPLPFSMVNNRRSLLALDNLTSFVALCVDHPGAANELFVIADGDDVSTAELLRRTAHSHQKKVRLFPVPVCFMYFAARLLRKRAAAESLLGSLQINSDKARKLLGWRPVVTMDEQLKQCFD